MENIISQIIKIDDNAKNLVRKQESIKKKLEDHIENEYKEKEGILMDEYNNKIADKRNEYGLKLENSIQNINYTELLKIKKIKEEFSANMEKLVDAVIDEIKQEVN